MDRQQRDATAALEATIQLGRGQAASASQPEQSPNAPPQQAPNPSPLLQLVNPQRPKQPPYVQQDIPIQDPEQQPPPRTGRDNPQYQRKNKAEQPPRSLRHPMADEQNPPSRGQHPSANIRLEDAIANEGKSHAKDKGPKEYLAKAANGSDKPNDNGNGKNGGKRASNEPSTSENKRSKVNSPHLPGDSGKARERYARTLRHDQDIEMLNVDERMPKNARTEDELITFSEFDAQHVQFPNSDP
ncbi:uncharacterized protein LOC133832887 [Humulus lupulus]|uniref:uncharacterized protein LOC133832887 n=1 Tax=Humulus lupulus TaxID=3486 RepID=UPI002B4063D9|nr:uncharacterized protein LOC133832887 [Humulus lupulus]